MGTALVAGTFAALVLNERVGSLPIMAAVGGWALLAMVYPVALLRSLRLGGWAPWAVPALACLSAAWSLAPGQTLRTGAELVLTVVLAMWCASVVRFRTMLMAVFGVLTLVLAASLVSNRSYYDATTGVVSMAGIFSNKNTLAACGGTLTLVSAALALGAARSGAIRLACLAVAPVSLAVTFLARSVAVTISTAVALGLLLAFAAGGKLFRQERRAFVEVALLGLVLVGGLVDVVVANFSDELLRLVGKSPTLTGRTVLWYFADRFALDRPLLGVGYQAFWVQGYQPAEFLWRLLHIEGRYGFHFHSLYYELLVELGYAGVLVGGFAILVAAADSIRWLWLRLDGESAFAFSFLAFMLLVQLQGVDLFWLFDPWYFLFVVFARYAAQAVRARPGPARPVTPGVPAMPSLLASAAAGPTPFASQRLRRGAS